MKKRSTSYEPRAGFKVPEGYFDSLQDRIMESAETDKIERELPGHGLGVPAQYFDSFEMRLMQRLEKTTAPKPKSRIRKLVFTRSLKYAAAVAVALLLFSTLFNSNQPVASDGLESIDLLSLEGYLQEARETPHSNLQFIISEERDSLASESDDIIIDQEALLEYLREHIDEPSILFYED